MTHSFPTLRSSDLAGLPALCLGCLESRLGRSRSAGGGGVREWRRFALRADRHADPEELGRGRSGLRLYERYLPDRRGLQRHAGVGPPHPWGACDRKLLLLTCDPSKEGLRSEAGGILDRKSVVEGTSVSVRVEPVGGRIIK